MDARGTDHAKETAVSPVLGRPRDSCMRDRQGIVAIFSPSELWLLPVVSLPLCCVFK
jgi:hypothetical protein